METFKGVFVGQLRKELEEDKRGNRIGLSEVGKCKRMHTLKTSGAVQTPISDEELMTFEHGRIMERTYVEKCMKTGKVIYPKVFGEQAEVEYRGIKGHPDLIEKLNGENVLADLKSCKQGSTSYKKNDDGSWNYGKVGDDYLCQLTSYFYSKLTDGTPFAEHYKLDPVGSIVFMQKDSLLIDECPVKFSDFKALLDQNVDEVLFWQKEGKLAPERELVDSKYNNYYPCFGMQTLDNYKKKLKPWCHYLPHCPKIMAKYEQLFKDISAKNKEVKTYGSRKKMS